MNLNKFSILTIVFGVLCIISILFYFSNKISIDYVILILGLTQLFSGLSQIKTSKSLTKKEGINGNKIIGITISVMGVFFIIAASIKILF